MSVAFTDILAARKRIAAHIHHTVLRPSVALSARAGVPVSLKCEFEQLTGAFKLRGATNAVLSLSDAERRRGVTTASTGNHGRALSHAARMTGTKAIICMSSLVPQNKVQAVRGLGAEVRIIGNSQDDAQVEVDRLVAEEGMIAIPPFDRAEVIAGQGTIGIEIFEDDPALETVIVPLSGGGLIAGVALAAKTLNPDCRVIGVSMEQGAAMHESLGAGHPVDVTETATLADSLGGGIGLDNRLTFAMVRDLVDQTILVSERAIAEAVQYAYFEERAVLEGAAAVGIAALLTEQLRPEGPTVLVLSGGNIDTHAHLSILDGSHDVFKAER